MAMMRNSLSYGLGRQEAMRLVSESLCGWSLYMGVKVDGAFGGLRFLASGHAGHWSGPGVAKTQSHAWLNGHRRAMLYALAGPKAVPWVEPWSFFSTISRHES